MFVGTPPPLKINSCGQILLVNKLSPFEGVGKIKIANHIVYAVLFLLTTEININTSISYRN